MIGNDVVDLALAREENNWRRKGFLTRVFTPSELGSIDKAENQELQVWLLWSMKEAAYKAHQRKFSRPRQLNWKVQECSVTSLFETGAKGEVSIEGTVYYSRTEFISGAVHTIASAMEFQEMFVEIRAASSASVKADLLLQVSEFYGFPKDELSIEKNREGVPTVHFSQEKTVLESSRNKHLKKDVNITSAEKGKYTGQNGSSLAQTSVPEEAGDSCSLPFSFSHHGRFAGYCLPLMKTQTSVKHS